MIIIIDNVDWKNTNLVNELEKHLIHKDPIKNSVIESEVVANQSSYLINNPSMTDGILVHEVIKAACFHNEGYYKIRKYGMYAELVTITHNKFPKKPSRVKDHFYPQKFDPPKVGEVHESTESVIPPVSVEPQPQLEVTPDVAQDLQESLTSFTPEPPQKKYPKIQMIKFEDIVSSLTSNSSFEVEANPTKVRSMGILDGVKILTIIPKGSKLKVSNGSFTTNDETIANCLIAKGKNQ